MGNNDHEEPSLQYQRWFPRNDTLFWRAFQIEQEGEDEG